MPPSLRPCLRPSSLPKFRPRIQQHIRSRAFVDAPKPRRPNEPPKGVWAPKTRIAVGIVFIGALIYSMVALPHYAPVIYINTLRLRKSQRSSTALQSQNE